LTELHINSNYQEFKQTRKGFRQYQRTKNGNESTGSESEVYSSDDQNIDEGLSLTEQLRMQEKRQKAKSKKQELKIKCKQKLNR
jgi:hypothetical protein